MVYNRCIGCNFYRSESGTCTRKSFFATKFFKPIMESAVGNGLLSTKLFLSQFADLPGLNKLVPGLGSSSLHNILVMILHRTGSIQKYWQVTDGERCT